MSDGIGAVHAVTGSSGKSSRDTGLTFNRDELLKKMDVWSFANLHGAAEGSTHAK